MRAPTRCALKLTCLLFAVTITSCATAEKDRSPESLLDILVTHALQEGPQGRIVYVSKEPVPGGSTIGSWQSEFLVPAKFKRAWFFFVDDVPDANWEHPCRYVFVDIDTGDFHIEEARTPPRELGNMMKLFPTVTNDKEE